jgi:hypothetical protein
LLDRNFSSMAIAKPITPPPIIKTSLVISISH